MNSLDHQETKENGYDTSLHQPQQNGNGVCEPKKLPLKFLMDPRGQVQDLQSIRQCGLYEPNSMSPEVCLELVNALNAPQGKGIFI